MTIGAKLCYTLSARVARTREGAGSSDNSPVSECATSLMEDASRLITVKVLTLSLKGPTTLETAQPFDIFCDSGHHLNSDHSPVANTAAEWALEVRPPLG